MSTIAIVIICQFAMLAIVWGLLSTQMEVIRKNVEKEVGEVRDVLDKVAENSGSREGTASGEPTIILQGKAVPAHAPVTVDLIRDVIRSNGVELLAPEQGQRPTDVMFRANDLIFRVNAGRLPFISMELGFGLDLKKMDLDLLYKSAREVSDSMFVAKVAVAEQAGTLLFQAEFYCDTVAYLYNNFRLFQNLLMETSERHQLVYDRSRLESEKTLESIVSSAFQKGAPDDQSQN